MQNDTREVKLIIIGDANVGKTSLLLRYCDNEYSENLVHTINVDFKEKRMKYNDGTAAVRVWDTAGQERYRTVTSTFYRDADVVVLVYDITDECSFKNLDRWHGEIESHTPYSHKLLIGNKIDLADQRQITEQQAANWSNNRSYIFREVSSKTGANVQNSFNDIIMAFLDTTAAIKEPKKSITIQKGTTNTQKKRSFLKCK